MYNKYYDILGISKGASKEDIKKAYKEIALSCHPDKLIHIKDETEKNKKIEKFKEASIKLAEMEAVRMLMIKRGNLQKELSQIGEEAGEGTEIQTVTMFKLMKAFEKVIQRIQQRNNKPVHTVVQYNYTMEECRTYILDLASTEKTLSFERIFEDCENRIHAIFLFLNMLELVQQKYLQIITGEGRNNFIIEFNENREEEVHHPLTDEDFSHLN